MLIGNMVSNFFRILISVPGLLLKYRQALGSLDNRHLLLAVLEASNQTESAHVLSPWNVPFL